MWRRNAMYGERMGVGWCPSFKTMRLSSEPVRGGRQLAIASVDVPFRTLRIVPRNDIRWTPFRLLLIVSNLRHLDSGLF